MIDERPVGWVVFYAERGVEREIRHFDTEGEACLHLLGKVANRAV